MWQMNYPKIKLKAARVNRGLSQKEAGEAIGRSKQTIINWENGNTGIRFKDLSALSELYGIPVEYLEIPEKREPEAAADLSTDPDTDAAPYESS